MFSEEQLKIVSNFLVDGAKIVFASLVIGVFVPEASGKIPWLTFLVGIIMTISFLALSIKLLKEKSKA